MIAVVQEEVLEWCQDVFPSWRGLTTDDFTFDDPKGFSSFTMAVRSKRDVDPPAVLYRHLATKENAILDFETGRDTFILLGEHRIAAHCHHYDETVMEHGLADPPHFRIAAPSVDACTRYRLVG